MGIKHMQTRPKKSRHFIMITYLMFDSDAWRSLSPVARSLWFEVSRRYNGYNNGAIPFSCLEAGRLLGVSKNTANVAFKTLQESGFLKIAIPAGFNQKRRVSTRWILTHHAYGEKLATNDWKSFKPAPKKEKHGHVSVSKKSHKSDLGYHVGVYSHA